MTLRGNRSVQEPTHTFEGMGFYVDLKGFFLVLEEGLSKEDRRGVQVRAHDSMRGIQRSPGPLVFIDFICLTVDPISSLEPFGGFGILYRLIF